MSCQVLTRWRAAGAAKMVMLHMMVIVQLTPGRSAQFYDVCHYTTFFDDHNLHRTHQLMTAA
jgi:hypothetical protein